MAVKMGEFLGILINITNKQTNQAYPEDDVRTKFKNQRVIGLIGEDEESLLLFESEKTIWEFKIRDVKRNVMQ